MVESHNTSPESLSQQYLAEAEQIFGQVQKDVSDKVEGMGDTGDNDFTDEFAEERNDLNKGAFLLGKSDGVLGLQNNSQQINDRAGDIVIKAVGGHESASAVADGVLEAILTSQTRASYHEGFTQGQSERSDLLK